MDIKEKISKLDIKQKKSIPSVDKFRDIPPFFIEDQRKYQDTIKNATHYPQKLFLWDGFDKDGIVGYSSKEDFIAQIETGAIAEYDISMFPSQQTETADHSVRVRYEKNIVNYNQREDSVASLIYSQERPTYQTDIELDLRDRLIFATQEDIFGEANFGEPVPKDVPVFIIDNWDPQVNEFGVFQYAIITLRRIAGFKVKGTSDKTQIQFNFILGSAQPQNVKRARITWKSKPILWDLGFLDADNTRVPWKHTPATTGKPFITPFLPKMGTKLNFIPSFLNEIAYWSTNYSKWRYEMISSALINSGYYWKTNNNASSLRDGNPGGHIQGNYSWANTPLKHQKAPIPDTEYRMFYISITSRSNNEINRYRRELYAIEAESMYLMSPFNFVGAVIETNIEGSNQLTLPRKQDQYEAVWKTFKDETYWMVDMVQAVSQEGVDVPYTSSISEIVLNNPTKIVDIAEDLVNGEATMYGTTLNSNPPAVYDKDFDTLDDPQEWSKENMLPYVGVVYLDEDDGAFGKDGSSAFFEIDKIDASQYPVAATNEVELIDFFNDSMRIQYASAISENLKARTAGRDWYVNYDENWVSEVEFENPISILTSLPMSYFGGYEYTIEWFQNSYEDSLIDGDIPCTFEFDGKTYVLPASTNRAANRRGVVKALGETKIYGSGGTKTNDVLFEANKKAIENNEKKVYDLDTGKRIDNIHYRKEKK